jgi:histidinol dehydrogenase
MIRIIRPEEWQRSVDVLEGAADEWRTVLDIIADVRKRGDRALFEWAERLDGAKLESLRVSDEEIEQAVRRADREFIRSLEKAAERIRRFHEKQKERSWFETEESGAILGQLVRPLQRVGIYVPGGRAVYPSSVLMNAIPARVAGVKEMIMITPPRPDGTIADAVLVAARIAGVTAVFKAGGAQAIAALAFGTESVPAVDKIVGPGNLYVALAKRAVYGQVDIDSIAGPSEIAVVADETAHAGYVAADLLSQAEHDPLASSVLITPSAELAGLVQAEIERQCDRLERREIAERSIREQGAIVLVRDLDEAFDMANQIAPEHLEIMVREPWNWLGKVKNAGAVFLGSWSSEPVGDYLAGPNHVLPTSGTARFFSPLGVGDFLKRTSVISYTREALQVDGPDVIRLAEAEGLGGHAAAIRIRLMEGGE